MMAISPNIIQSARTLATNGASPSEIYHAVRIGMGGNPHIVEIMHCFREAFCLSLLEAKPLAAFTRNAERAIENEAFLNELMMDAMKSHWDEWPPCPIDIDPSWLTSDVLALTTGIYADYAFDRLPILADALQDAGCDNDDLLNHLRGGESHVQGCWALALVLGEP